VPTADAMILPGGTGYMSDAGMCGDYDSVIGMEKSVALERFVKKLRGERLTPAQGPASLSGLYLETDDATGLAKQVSPVRLGGRLSESCPKPS
jgi:calcineurin-like phosphoesterase